MVTNYCRANAGSAERVLSGWNLILPEGKQLTKAVFSMDDLANSPASTFLSINQNDVKEILNKLTKRNMTGSNIPVLQYDDLPNGYSGIFCLYRLEAKNGNWSRSRIVPVFETQAHDVYQSTAKMIFNALLNGNGMN